MLGPVKLKEPTACRVSGEGETDEKGMDIIMWHVCFCALYHCTLD